MKIVIKSLFVLLLCTFTSLYAEDVTTVEAKSSEISDNLDLEVIASVFAEAENLEDFEKRLNDPKTQISNLDLNEDGEVDYLRVLETSKDKTHVVTIQAVLGKDKFQDVASIDVEKNDKGETKVQVVGDVSMYGPNYIIAPAYSQPPIIFLFFWGPLYHPWRSPYYWGYYPPYYHPWHPYPRHRYRRNVNVHINVNHNYKRTTVRTSKNGASLQKKNKRNDYDAKSAKGISKKENTSKSVSSKTQTGKKVQSDWKPESQRVGKTSQVKGNKVSVPSKKDTSKLTNKSENYSRPKEISKPKSVNTPSKSFGGGSNFSKPAMRAPSSRPNIRR